MVDIISSAKYISIEKKDGNVCIRYRLGNNRIKGFVITLKDFAKLQKDMKKIKEE